MLWAWTGLIWLWLKNKGQKNFAQLKKDNPDYEQTGLDILWSLLLLVFLVSAFFGLTYLIYTFIRK